MKKFFRVNCILIPKKLLFHVATFFNFLQAEFVREEFRSEFQSQKYLTSHNKYISTYLLSEHSVLEWIYTKVITQDKEYHSMIGHTL